MADATNCPGVRDDDSVRPIQMCQQCQHWRSTGPISIAPHIVIVYRDAVPVLTCTRRLAVGADPCFPAAPSTHPGLL